MQRNEYDLACREMRRQTSRERETVDDGMMPRVVYAVQGVNS
jgi:hypothetical protein